MKVLDFFRLTRWLDGRPILATLEPYRRQIFTDVLDAWVGPVVRYTLALLGRGKKNAKSLDAVLACLFALCANDSVFGTDCYLVANDEDQAADDLELCKKLIAVSPELAAHVVVKAKDIARRDGKGTLAILPGRDVVGSHGRSYRLLAIDELHGHRDWGLLEALQPDPHRPDAQVWVTSYSTLWFKRGVPLYDLIQQAKAGTDPKLYCSWYAGDWCTDPAAAALPAAEARANPSMASWADPEGYLAAQRRRLPSNKYARLHLNIGGAPDGAAFDTGTVMAAVARGVTRRRPEPGVTYVGYVDMSGGSADDATLAIGHRAGDQGVLDVVMNQGRPCPFNPRDAVARFAAALREYGVREVVADRYAGLTFVHDFAQHGIVYTPASVAASDIYQALEPHLNAGEVVLLDVEELEAQTLGLVWRGNRITHLAADHDDWICAAAGALLLALDGGEPDLEPTDAELLQLQRVADGITDWRVPRGELGGYF